MIANVAPVVVDIDAEAEVRRLAQAVRMLWHKMGDRPYSPTLSADYRAAVAALTAALLAHPSAVTLDDGTVLMPNADGDGPAFVSTVLQREKYKVLPQLVEAHRRRFAARRAS